MSQELVDLDDIQGLVAFGYGKLKEACFLLLDVRDAAAARAWLSECQVNNAVKPKSAPCTALQVALSCRGLCALGVPKDIVQDFSPEFVAGMSSDESRARRLGDVGENDPARWQWGNTPQVVPHVVVLLYATEGRLAAWQDEVLAGCQAGFTLVKRLSTTDMGGREPFGFKDGISEPNIDWERERPAVDQELRDYTNIACLGEFVLGHPNEYGEYTERPLLDPQRHPDADLPRAEDQPDMADLGRNGSYLVLRQLRQDVGRFWQFVDGVAHGDVAARTHLAEAMVGRSIDGDPLIPTGEPIAGEDDPRNTFTYRGDEEGLHCPVGAHIRRSNPRNADLPPGTRGFISWAIRTLGCDADALANDHVSSTRFHRLLRRGREYGTKLTLQQALAAPLDTAHGDHERDGTGLHFICLAANITRQFEFVQGAWLAGVRFDSLHGESDPLLGNRQPDPAGAPTDSFSIPVANGCDRRVTGLPQFITVLGGGYFFMPGIRALRFLSKVQP
ncbi:hypothetical protein [Variovorax sp. dw_308]|uniref:Dyp-type peroxidase n=1 Tax=Variovorax sp. dw_308 TaxID=2721546 RepID=UPI001C4657EE|nr:hypothetical protein [Variovorax sp. dw_308]